MKTFVRLFLLILSAPVAVNFLIFCIGFVPVTNAGALPLNKFLHRYEALHYDTEALEQRHQRARRSVDSGTSVPEVHLDLKSHGREFRIRLVRDTQTFDSSSVVIVDGKPSQSDFSHIYHGYLEGEPSSYVHGSIINGIFAGRIDTRDQTYYVEKSYLHFTGKQPFHSFIYSSDDVLHLPPDRNHQSMDSSSCGLMDSRIHDWMKKVQSSANETSPKRPTKRLNAENPYLKYANSREKRDANSEKRMCSLLLQSDPMLWAYIKNRTGADNSQIRNEITAFFASHVNGVKSIYFNTTFQYNSFGPYTGITFGVYRMQINTSNCTANPNPFCKPNIDVSNFLNLNSLTNHDLYCLAFVFTFRDFAQGTLGLAWVGSTERGVPGGICEKFRSYNQDAYKSLNTGIVTLSNYGSRVPTKVSLLTFAHEIGHGFGSQHDSGSECVPLLNNPNNPLGNYIMYASATSGDKPNNQKFSKCSIGNMTLVIDAVLKELNGKSNCFVTPYQSFCGNRIVEDSEECDCGFEEDCNLQPDNCCFPRDSASVSQQCRRKPNAFCSPSEGPCCLGSCSFISQSTNSSCQDASECSMESFCNGSSAKCPAPMAKQDYSICNENTQICKKGECEGSVCEKIQWTKCDLTAPVNDKTFDRGQLCFVSCLNPATNSCVTTGNQKELEKQENKPLLDLLDSVNLRTTGIRLPAGTPCDNYHGYCDVFRKCRTVNEDGPLARLTNLLFSQQALTTVRDWITVYWWAVLLMGVAFVVGMGLFIKICAVHTPSSNPNQKPARKLGDLTISRRHHSRQQDSSSADTRPIHPVSHISSEGKKKKVPTATLR